MEVYLIPASKTKVLQQWQNRQREWLRAKNFIQHHTGMSPETINTHGRCRWTMTTPPSKLPNGVTTEVTNGVVEYRPDPATDKGQEILKLWGESKIPSIDPDELARMLGLKEVTEFEIEFDKVQGILVATHIQGKGLSDKKLENIGFRKVPLMLSWGDQRFRREDFPTDEAHNNIVMYSYIKNLADQVILNEATASEELLSGNSVPDHVATEARKLQDEKAESGKLQLYNNEGGLIYEVKISTDEIRQAKQQHLTNGSNGQS